MNPVFCCLNNGIITVTFVSIWKCLSSSLEVNIMSPTTGCIKILFRSFFFFLSQKSLGMMSCFKTLKPHKSKCLLLNTFRIVLQNVSIYHSWAVGKLCCVTVKSVHSNYCCGHTHRIYWVYLKQLLFDGRLLLSCIYRLNWSILYLRNMEDHFI